jgi:hypothetical protein
MGTGNRSHGRRTGWEGAILRFNRFVLPWMACQARWGRETATRVAIRKIQCEPPLCRSNEGRLEHAGTLGNLKFSAGDGSGGGLAGHVLPVAERGEWCQSSGMSFRPACMLGVISVFALPLLAAEDAKPEVKVADNGIPADLLDDPHVREELAVNEFTAPSISKLFDTLQFLMPLPVVETERKMPARMPMDRADLAIELGFLIADGFLVVQAEQLEKVEDLAKDLTRYGKALGAGDRVNRHSASLLDSAKKKDVVQLKKELSATQRDVEAELVTLRDADLAHLISLGGWIRALEVSTVAVDKQFSEERARKVMREDIADYYTESVAGLEPRISERPNYLAMRDVLAGLRTEMVLKEGDEPTVEMMKEIRKQAAKLVELALQRKQ